MPAIEDWGIFWIFDSFGLGCDTKLHRVDRGIDYYYDAFCRISCLITGEGRFQLIGWMVYVCDLDYDIFLSQG